MKNINKALILLLLGGFSYYLIEVLWRGYSHPSMFVLGGLLFLLIGNINEYFTYEIPLWKQCLISTIIITILEFLTGIVLNIIFHWNVWNYSSLSFNILGQVSLLYSALWFFLSAIAIVFDDLLRWLIFKEEFPHYKII